MALNDKEWQSLTLFAEWQRMALNNKNAPAIKQSQTANAIMLFYFGAIVSNLAEKSARFFADEIIAEIRGLGY